MNSAKRQPTTAPISAEHSQELAADALEFMREHEADPNRCFGYAWGILRTIAGQPMAPMPLPASKTVTP